MKKPLIPKQYRYIAVFTAGLIFCSFWGIKSLLVLCAVIFITWLSAILTDVSQKKGKSGRFSFWIGLVLTVLIFLAFKILPSRTDLFSVIGLSFYSLQAIGYLIDVYNGKSEAERNPVRYGAFVSFFPTFLSGPIQRSSFLLPKLREGTPFSYELARKGLYRIIWGLFQKILIADRIHVLLEPVFTDVGNKNGAALLFGMIMYGIELYADFAGYSLIAVGAANLFGFDLESNFRQPYLSESFRDFWKSWHISLSTWLRDYIYIPLGGSRKGKGRKCLNLFITFLVSGFWHGNGLKYIVWGLYHGLLQVLYSLFPKPAEKEDQGSKRRIPRPVRWLFTFILADIGWVLFRADSLRDSILIVQRILFHPHFGSSLGGFSFLCGYDPGRFFLLLFEILILLSADILAKTKGGIMKILDNMPALLRRSLVMVLLLSLLVGALYNFGSEASAFIYAQF